MTIGDVIKQEYARRQGQGDCPTKLQQVFAEWWVKRFPEGFATSPEYLFEAFMIGYETNF